MVTSPSKLAARLAGEEAGELARALDLDVHRFSRR